MSERRIKLATMNPELVTTQIGNFIIKQIVQMGYNGGVLGLSGGVDSTSVGALANYAFTRYNALSIGERIKQFNAVNPRQNLELTGFMLPSNTNNPKDTEDGEKVAKRLAIDYGIINIELVVEAYKLTNPETFNRNFTKGNLMSEIRATILHAKAGALTRLVLGTGNRDEDFGVGYYTLFGDGAVHMSPIGALPKRLVRDLARYLGFADLADRIPTAGLEPGQTDFGDLGYKYEMVELVSEGVLQKFSPSKIFMHPQVRDMAHENILLYEKTFGKQKFTNEDDMLNDIFKRRRIAEDKAKLVSPPIAPVTLTYK